MYACMIEENRTHDQDQDQDQDTTGTHDRNTGPAHDNRKSEEHQQAENLNIYV